MEQYGEIILYQPDETVKLEVRLEDETVWLTQAQIVELFQSSKANISGHIKNIYEQQKLGENTTVRDFRTVRLEGKRQVVRKLTYYNLDAIISIGFRVNSKRGILFRQWANKVFAQISFDSGIVMMFRVHDDIRYIGKSKFPRILSQIEDYYSKSNFFMSKKLLRLRAMLADNNKTRDEDIALVLKNINSKDSDLISDAYYVIVAKPNSQSQETVLNLFVAAFNGCDNNIQNRYKLIAKLEHHNLLVHEKVLDCMLFSNIPKDWEVYLGLLLDNDELLGEFRELWSQSDADSKFKRIKEKACHEDWRQVDKLMTSIMENVKYIKGDVEI